MQEVCGHCGQVIPQESSQVVRLLTVREVQVLALIAAGLADKGIADALGCSDQTIKRHGTHIRDKVGLDNRVELANYFWARPTLVKAAVELDGVAPLAGIGRSAFTAMVVLKHCPRVA